MCQFIVVFLVIGATIRQNDQVPGGNLNSGVQDRQAIPVSSTGPLTGEVPNEVRGKVRGEVPREVPDEVLYENSQPFTVSPIPINDLRAYVDRQKQQDKPYMDEYQVNIL